MATASEVKSEIIQVEDRIQIKLNKREGILNFDRDNAYPQRMKKACALSGRATNCIETFSKFIEGSGLNDPKIYSAIVNSSGQKFDEVHKANAESVALFRGFALHFQFNGLGQWTEVRPIPFEELRLKPDKEGKVIRVLHAVDWSDKNLKKDSITEYFLFNPDPETIAEEVLNSGGIEKYPGQILYCSMDGPFKYPLSSLDPIWLECLSDNEGKHQRFSNITSNFLASHLLVTEPYKSEESREQLHKSIKEKQGSRNSSKFWHVEKPSKDSTFDLKKIEIQDTDKLFTVTNAEVKENIRSRFAIPPVLLGDQTPGKLGPSQQEMQDAYSFYNAYTASERRWLLQQYQLFFQYSENKTFANAEGVSILPASFESGNEGQPLAIQLGVGGTQSLTSIVVDTALSKEQKSNALQILFGLTASQASAIVNGTPIQIEG